jgi:hypothetical protein
MKRAFAISVIVCFSIITSPQSFASDPTVDLIAHWTFDEDNFASGVHDEIGVYNGTAVNATRVAGKVGAGALSLNGSNAYVLVGGQGTALQLTNTAYTIAWWQKWAGATSSHQNIYAMDDGADYSAGYSAYLFQGTASMGIVHNDGVTRGWFGATTTDQNWHHYAITYSGTQLRLYVDGVFSNSKTVSGPIRGEDDPLVIGGIRLQNGSFANFFKGVIDDFRIYRVALVDQEVAILCGQAAVPSDGPIAIYPLDGNAVDLSGHSLNGAVIGATPITNRFGASQSAFTFNGVSDLINCGTAPAFNFASNFTISAWVKLNGFQAAKYIVAKYNGAFAPRSFGLATDTRGSRAYAFVSSPTGPYVECSDGPSLNDSKWHSLNFVYDNAVGIRLYVDGSLVASKPAIGYAPFSNSAVPLTIGGLTSGQFFGGQIDDLKIYDRALPSSEVQSRFTAEKEGVVARYDLNGNAEDLSGNGLDGTIVGTTAVVDRFGNQTGALNFDGFTDYIDLGNRPEFNFTRDFTVTAWVKLNGTQPAKYILAKYADFGGGLRSPRSYGLATDDESRVYAFVSSADAAYTASGGRIMSDGYWHAIAFSYNADYGIMLYQDGLYAGSRSAVGLPAFTNSVPLTIGRASSGQWFSGSIDDVRIYSRTLSALEIKNVYQTEFGEVIAISPAVKLEFPTLPMRRYQLEFSTDLTTWAPLGDSFMAPWTPTNVSRFVDAPLNGQYYRLKAMAIPSP